MNKKLFLLALLLLLLTVGISVSAQGTYQEAPMLAEMVAAGTLPPVAERLPANPVVLDPVEEIGQYGGTWHLFDPSDTLGRTSQTVFTDNFLKWNRDANGMRPNLVQTWEWNDDSTEITIHIVEGIKWSDGEPLTVDDYLFWWNDMVLDEDVPSSPPDGTQFNGVPMTVEKVDDYSLHFTFPQPNPLFLETQSRGSYYSSNHFVPAHYLEQFHPKYNTAVENSDELIAHTDFNSHLHYPDMPTFMAWRVAEYTSGQLVVLERNPYYWKVDSAGNQLPYIDRIEVKIGAPGSNAGEQILQEAIAGNLDMQTRDIDIKDISVLLENQEAGDYRVIMWNQGDFASPWLILHYDNVDEGLNDLMYQKEFRQALSVSIDRERINNIVNLGLAKVHQFVLSAESPEFQTEAGQQVYNDWANSFASYDPEAAMALLDSIGVVDADGDGWRDRPDGSKLDVIVDVPSSDQGNIDSMDLIKENWDAIGLNTTLAIADWSSAIDPRIEAGEVFIMAWPGAAAWGLISAPGAWTPIENTTYNMGGQLLGRYYVTGGQEGVAARAGSPLEQLQQAYTELITIQDPAERYAKLLEAYQIHITEGPFSIGTVGDHPSPTIVKNNFHNVPPTGVTASWDLGFPGSADPEQFYISQ
jgi:peptide/nickel transport system substrate-binding protein